MSVRIALFTLAAVACGSPHNEVTTPTTPPPAEPEPSTTPLTPEQLAVVPPAPAIVHQPQTRGPIVSPHGGVIDLVAITPDGTSALTIDELGGTRLWPALDGSTEPLVVTLPAAKQIAIGKRPGGYTAVVLDDVGGVIVIALDAQGRTQSHATLSPDPAYVAIAMSSLGAVVVRSDQTITLLDDAGTPKQMIGTEPGYRVAQLLVRDNRVIALLATSTGTTEQRRPRTLTLEPKLAWGAWIGAASSQPGVKVAVSPNGTRIAWLTKQSDTSTPQITALDLSKTGTQLLQQNAGDATLIDFVDDDHLLVVGFSVGQIYDLTTKTALTLPTPPSGLRPSKATAGVAAGRVVSPYEGELAIIQGNDTQYLGYELLSPAIATSADKGQLAIGLGQTFFLVDSKLDVVSKLDLSLPADTAVNDLEWLGSDDWAVLLSRTTDGTTSLVLSAAAQKSIYRARENMKSVSVLAFEPSTQLLTMSFGDVPEAYRHDAKTHKLERVSSITQSKKTYDQTSLIPLSPKLAGGYEMLRLTHRDTLSMQWLRDARSLDRAGATATAASFAAADAAGHAFAWRNTPAGKLELAVFAAGRDIGVLPTDGPVGLWPNTTGSHVLQISARTLALYTPEGKLEWIQQLSGQTEAIWLDDGALAVLSTSGVARLDPKTGNVTASRCGWNFGLSKKPHPPGSRIEPVCAQLDR